MNTATARAATSPRVDATQVGRFEGHGSVTIWSYRTVHRLDDLLRPEFWASRNLGFKRDDRVEVVADTGAPRSTHATLIVRSASLKAVELEVLRASE